MPQTFTQDVVIDGSADAKQLRVQGHTTQTNPLQTWEDSAGNTLAQVTGDGRVQVGDDVGLASPDALIEAHRHENSTTKPKRGFHALGRVTGVLNSLVQWAVHELELLGTGGISALHSALRVKLTNRNTGTMQTGADLRAGDIEAVNSGGTSGSRVPKLTGLQVAVTNEAGGFVNEAVGVRISVNNGNTTPGSVTKPYSIWADDAVAHFGAPQELKVLTTQPVLNAPAGQAQVYVRKIGNDNHQLFYQENGSVERGFGSATRIISAASFGNPVTTADLTTILGALDFTHLEILARLRSTAVATGVQVFMYFNNDLVDANYRSILTFNSGAAGVALEANNALIAGCPGSQSPAGWVGYARIFIPYYRQPGYQQAQIFTSAPYSNTNIYMFNAMLQWRTAAQINSISLKMGTGNFDAGTASDFTVYGYKD